MQEIDDGNPQSLSAEGELKKLQSCTQKLDESLLIFTSSLQRYSLNLQGWIQGQIGKIPQFTLLLW